MKFLVDQCAGRKLADWLIAEGHDVVFVGELGPDPGDARLLELAASEQRVLITIDSDFGTLIFRDHQPHAGLVRLGDVTPAERIGTVRRLLAELPSMMRPGVIITATTDPPRVTYTD